MDTVELLEAILDYLPAKDVLLAQHVCVHFRQTVQRSLRLKQKLHLEPRLVPAAPRELLGFHKRGITCGAMGNEYGVRVQTSLARAVDTSHESWRSMLVSQPPFRKMTFQHDASKMGRITSEEGVTLGQLADVAASYSMSRSSMLFEFEFGRVVHTSEATAGGTRD